MEEKNTEKLIVRKYANTRPIQERIASHAYSY